jgi:hypothetical protein
MLLSNKLCAYLTGILKQLDNQTHEYLVTFYFYGVGAQGDPCIATI